MFRGAGLVTALILCGHTVFAGVVLDGSFGTSGALPGPNYMISAGFGKQVGTNLFQSFNQFNLISAESATFTGPANIHNIVSRVTGGSPSSIDGKVNSDIQGANLFFVNPSGVVFGQHAQINTTGSVVISTAHYLKMADGGRFNASLGGTDTLTSAPISAFGFLNPNPAPVTFSNAILSSASGQSFSVIAGDITFNGTQLSAPGGNIALFSARATGEVAYDETAPSAHFRDSTLTDFGNVTIQGAAKLAIDSASGGGKIAMRGGQLLATNSSTVSSSNQGSNLGGDIELTADALSVLNGARVVAQTVSSGDGGNVSVQSTDLTVSGDNGVRNSSIRSNATSGTGNAGSLVVNTTNLSLTNGGTLNGNTLSAGRGAPITVNAENAVMSDPGTLGLGSGIFESVRPGATGNASDVNVNITGMLTILNGGAISDTTFSSGNGGNLNIHAGSLSIDGSAAPGIFTGIATDSNPGATGNTGNLTVTVDQTLNILGGGEISTTTFTSGNGGNLNLHAGSLSIDGSLAPGRSTGIRVETDGAGDAGNLFLTVDQALTLIGGGSVNTITTFSGRGGDMSISAGSLLVDGSFIAADSNPGATGNAGNLTISVQAGLNITAAGAISADTFSSGNGGELTIHAGSVTIDGTATPGFFTGIAVSTNSGATGNAGNLTMAVDHALNIIGNGVITSGTFSSGGKGGNLNIHAGSLSIDGSATPGQFTGISADTDSGATGNAGNLTVTVDNLLNIVGGGEIAARTLTSGNGGNIDVHASSLSIDGSGSFFTGIFATAFSSGNAGNLTIRVDQGLNVLGGGEISANTFSTGSGGALNLQAGSLLVDGGSFIAADSKPGATGNAGNLTIFVQNDLSISGAGAISADTYSSGNGGDLSIHAGSVTIDGTTTPGFLTGIAVSTNPGATGNAGDLTIAVDRALNIVGAGEIISGTFSSGKGGNLNIHAGSLSIDGSAAPHFFTGISADTDFGATGNAGNLAVTVDQALNITGGGEISARTFTSGNGGNIDVHAGSVAIDGAPHVFTGIFASCFGAGNAGNVSLVVDQTLSLTRTGEISVATFSSGKGGALTVQTGSLSIDGSGTMSGLPITGILASTSGSGDGGDLTINVNQALSLTGGGEIAATTMAGGNGGSVFIHSGSIAIDGSVGGGFTGISVASTSGATGDAGSVTLQIDGSLDVTGGGQITAETRTSGNAGDIMIRSGSVSLSNGVISSSTAASGRGGNVTLTADSILLDKGSIFASALSGSSGDAGAVNLTGNSIVIRNQSFVSSGTDTTSTGAAGGVFLSGKTILLDTGGTVSSTSLGSGDGGKIMMTADSLIIQGNFGKTHPTAVDTSATGGGNAGDIHLAAHSLVLRGGADISSSSSNIGNAGNIFLKGSDVQINHGDTATTAFGTSTGNGGNITIQAQNLNIVNGRDLGISANALTNGGSINFRVANLAYVADTSITAAAGNAGGNITISNPLFIILSNSPISANASIGQGGNINLISSFFLASNSPVTATGAIANGTVNITAPSLDLGAELITLPSSLVDAQNQLRERCTSLLEGDYSSFISIGRGGTESEPDDLESTY